MEIVCHRHTTSKLAKYEDLRSIQTFGFRGEALAAISRVAKVKIISKTKSQEVAYSAEYDSNGNMLPKTLTPCAGNIGTIIKVEELFYNDKHRREYLSKENEEFRRIADVVAKYALNNVGISFRLVKVGNNSIIDPAVTTNHSETIIDRIRSLFSRDAAKDAVSISKEIPRLKLSISGVITKTTFHSPKSNFILFVNKRLVDNREIKKGVDNIYDSYLPRKTHPFVFLRLDMEPSYLDVNVHPSKEEVKMQFEQEVVKEIQEIIKEKLLSEAPTKTFQVAAPITPQKSSLLDTTATETSSSHSNQTISSIEESRTASTITTSIANSKIPKLNNGYKPLPHEKIRVEQQKGDIELFLEPTSSVNNLEELRVGVLWKDSNAEAFGLLSRKVLKKEVEKQSSTELEQMFQKHSFVGWINPSFSLIQFKSALYLIDVYNTSLALFYQIALDKLGSFSKIEFPGIKIQDLIEFHLSNLYEDSCSKYATKLISQRNMLEEYFGITINEEGELLSLPEILPGYVPPLNRLPEFICKIVTEVNWKQEQQFLQQFCKQLAYFYALPREWEVEDVQSSQQQSQATASTAPDNSMDAFAQGYTTKQAQWVTEHLFFPCCKFNFKPPSDFISNAIVREISTLPNLYKVFERC